MSWLDGLLLKAATPILWMIPARSLPRLLAAASAVTEAARTDARRAGHLANQDDPQAVNAAIAAFLATLA